MRLYIPALKDELTVAADWKFSLYLEQRNSSLITLVEGHDLDWEFWDKAIKYAYRNWIWIPTDEYAKRYPCDFKIPAGSVLIVDRIYIRKGAKEFDSLTFRVKSSPDERLTKCRFWAKLSDVNTMEVENGS